MADEEAEMTRKAAIVGVVGRTNAGRVLGDTPMPEEA